MTIVVYDKDTLYADRRGVMGPFEQMEYCADAPKLYKSLAGHYAYGITGQLLDACKRATLEEILSRVVECLGYDKPKASSIITEDELSAVSWYGSILLMTKSRVIHITDKSYNVVLEDHHFALGSGCGMYIGFKAYGLSTADALAKIPTVSYEVGPIIDKIHRDELIDLVTVPDTAEAIAALARELNQ